MQAKKVLQRIFNSRKCQRLRGVDRAEYKLSALPQRPFGVLTLCEKPVSQFYLVPISELLDDKAVEDAFLFCAGVLAALTEDAKARRNIIDKYWKPAQ